MDCSSAVYNGHALLGVEAQILFYPLQSSTFVHNIVIRIKRLSTIVIFPSLSNYHEVFILLQALGRCLSGCIKQVKFNSIIEKCFMGGKTQKKLQRVSRCHHCLEFAALEGFLVCLLIIIEYAVVHSMCIVRALQTNGHILHIQPDRTCILYTMHKNGQVKTTFRKSLSPLSRHTKNIYGCHT